MDLLSTLNLTIALASLAMAVASIALYADYSFWDGKYFAEQLEKLTWPLLLAITIGSVVMSLVYSDYFGFIPCSLCWLQRIAIYPQALMAILAFRAKDTLNFPVYGIWLSLFGLVVAVYQYIYQMMPKETASSGLVPCLVDAVDADCAVKVIDLFGFVTFPFISAVTFVFLIIIYLYMLRAHKDNNSILNILR